MRKDQTCQPPQESNFFKVNIQHPFLFNIKSDRAPIDVAMYLNLARSGSGRGISIQDIYQKINAPGMVHQYYNWAERRVN